MADVPASKKARRARIVFRQDDVAEKQHQAFTFSVATWNLWKTGGVPTSWELRRDSVRRALATVSPDVLFVQELHPDIAETVLEGLGDRYSCVHESVLATLDGGKAQSEEETIEGVPSGWFYEGNIFYNSQLFELVESGTQDIGQKERFRRLFWARLKPKNQNGRTILVSTAHFTWQGHAAEWESDINLRKAQARATATFLDTVQRNSEPCIFGGDLNESYWPKAVLNFNHFFDCFSALRLPLRPTHPARPSVAHEENNADSVLDWLFARRGKADASVQPILARVMSDLVGLSSNDPDEELQLGVQPSDHCMVMAVYRCWGE